MRVSHVAPALLGLVMFGVVACTSTGTQTAPDPPEVLAAEQVAALTGELPQRSIKPLPVARLAEGLIPPTNRWYSGLVFGTAPQPVFPLPLGFSLTPDGFSFGLPKVTATAKTISGGFTPDVAVEMGAARSIVTSSDPSVLVLANQGPDGASLGHTTIAQGSPFVSWVAERSTTLTVPEGFSPSGDGLYVATLGGNRYAMATTAPVTGRSVAVEPGVRVVFWPVPKDHEPAELASAATHLVTGSRLAYQVGESEVTTTLTYRSDAPTVIARMPHQGTAATCELGSYPSIYGELTLCSGSQLSWTTPRVPARASLDLSVLDDSQRAQLTQLLDVDLAQLPDFPRDTYFGGKALQRTAMLLMVADQLKLENQSRALAEKLDAELSRWFDPKGCRSREAGCFVYDPAAKGVVGLSASFGSEEFNDHHFHYGYFFYAAAVMAAHDPSVVRRYQPVATLLAADLASSGSAQFPERRTFDAYASHSWASGTAPFADGNNQESVSEAANAWAGLQLWAQASGDDALRDEAAWMLSLEASAGTRYWTNPDLSGFPGYTAGIVSLNWGAKRDYATWFSDAPAAKLGILLLPMSPTSVYLAGDPERIRANLAEASDGTFAQKFGDYLLMYSALAGRPDRDRAVTLAGSLPAAVLDDGMSRTYLTAWLLALRP